MKAIIKAQLRLPIRLVCFINTKKLLYFDKHTSLLQNRSLTLEV